MNSSLKDPNGFWVTHYVHVLGIVCNKSRLKTAVKEWKDFLDPKWKGDFSIDPERFQVGSMHCEESTVTRKRRS